MTRLLLICASLRQDSYHARLLQNLAAPLREQCVVDVLDPCEVHLPLFNEDLEQDAVTVRAVQALHARIARCDGLLVASPEYNGQMTAYLKNLVDWVSRLGYIDGQSQSPFIDRPVLLCSASTGRSGGAVGIAHARALFGHVGALVIGDTVCIPHIQQYWHDAHGFTWDAELQWRLDTACTRLLDWAGARSARHQHMTENIA